MKIRTILLSDDCDPFFTDLITFNRETTEEEVQNAILKCKNDLEGEYTNEDIYDYLEKYIGIENMIFLGDYKKFEY